MKKILYLAIILFFIPALCFGAGPFGSAWHQNADGTYSLPNDTDGLKVGSVSAVGTDSTAPAAVTSFTGTISAAIRTATFSETADYALCKVGSTLIAAGDTRIVIALLGSDQVTVDANTTWAGSTAITSLQEPQSQGKQSDGTVKNYVNADGGIGMLGGTGDLQKGLAFGDSGFAEESSNVITAYINAVEVMKFNNFGLISDSSSGGGVYNEVASATNPTLLPRNGDKYTGVGSVVSDQLSLIAGGVEAIRSIEANSIIYNVLNSVQQDTITDATSNGTTTITKTGENFSTTCTAGDTVLIWGGTTTADYGVYSIVTVTSDTALVLNAALSGSVSNMNFYVFRGGLITTADEVHAETVKFSNDIYIESDCSALTFTDRTPFYSGDAVTEIKAIKGVDGNIDHDTLPLFVQKDIVRKTTTYGPEKEVDVSEAVENYDSKILAEDIKIKEGYKYAEEDKKYYRKGLATTETLTLPGRDLGAMISMLTVAVQQLTDRIEALENPKVIGELPSK